MNVKFMKGGVEGGKMRVGARVRVCVRVNAKGELCLLC